MFCVGVMKANTVLRGGRAMPLTKLLNRNLFDGVWVFAMARTF